MIMPPSPELACVGHKMSMKKELGEIPTKELEDLIDDLSLKDIKIHDYATLSFFPNSDIFMY